MIKNHVNSTLFDYYLKKALLSDALNDYKITNGVDASDFVSCNDAEINNKNKNENLLYMQPSRGVFCWAVGDDCDFYLDLAYLQCLSLKHFSPNIKMSVGVWKNTKINEKYKKAFDQIIEVEKPTHKFRKYKKTINFYLESISNQIAPYDLTIKTDADLIWTSKIPDNYWHKINVFDLWFASEVVDFQNKIRDNSFRRTNWIKNSLPNIYSALMGFKKQSHRTQNFFSTCIWLFQNYEFYRSFVTETHYRHEPDTDWIFSIALQILQYHYYHKNSNWKFYHVTNDFVEKNFSNITVNYLDSWKLYFDEKRTYWGLNSLIYPLHLSVKPKNNIMNLIDVFEQKLEKKYKN